MAIETALIILVLYVMFGKRTARRFFKKKSAKGARSRAASETAFAPSEIDELVSEWQPEPLVAPVGDRGRRMIEAVPVIEKFAGTHVTVKGVAKPLLNLVSFDFLGLSQNQSVKQATADALHKYGCGSCGPRGFYGSIDVHIELENRIANFLGVPGAISYSDSASTVTSPLPAFAKKGDVLVLDAGCYEPLNVAARLSRATVKRFKHNDMDDLERVLKQISADDVRLKRRADAQRRFIVVEALYRNSGDICPLKRLVELKKKFRFRMMLDESFSFGTLGPTGRGLTELAGVPIEDVDILTLSCAYALGSVGGVCVGGDEVVDHQRLCGAGYCYSASAPPFTSSASMAALALLETTGATLIERLGANVAALVAGLKADAPGLCVVSDEASPVVHVALRDQAADASRAAQLDVLDAVAKAAAADGVLVVTSKLLGDVDLANDDAGDVVGLGADKPTLRLAVTAAHTEADMKRVGKVLGRAFALAKK